MKIAIIGTGYVGLVTGLCLAEKGHKIFCYDNDKIKIKKINDKILPIYEKDLKTLLDRNIKKNITFSNNLDYVIEASKVCIVAVGTPFNGKKIDLSQIKDISTQIGKKLKNINRFYHIIIKSTVVPGTTDKYVTKLLERYSRKELNKDFGVGMNPEFLREGSAVFDFMNPDRIIFGGSCNKTHDIMDQIYAKFKKVDKIKTNNKTAEMIKYVNNSFLATTISFSNEIGNLCSRIEGVDALDVMKGVHLDNRISPILNSKRVIGGITTYMKPGCGYGGSCFPKDTNSLVSYAKEKKYKMKILETVIETNDVQHNEIIKIIKSNFKSLRKLKVLILGLAFKPETDDMRHSPSIPIIKYLIKKRSLISAYDPIAISEAKKILRSKYLSFPKNLSEGIKNNDLILVLTESKEFSNLHLLLNKHRKKPIIIDGRRFLNKHNYLNYYGIGMKR